MTCPRCSVGVISSRTNTCEVCGYSTAGMVAVETPHPDSTYELACRELATQFQISALLGQGPASAVYLAREEESDRHVVLKVLLRRATRRPDAEAAFRRAIAAVSSLDHPHVVGILRHGITDSLFWYSMEHVRGRSLRDAVHAGGPMDLRSCQRIIGQVASALDYIHRRGLVHGDLKPENVLVDVDGWVHVADAHVARMCEPAPDLEAGAPAGPEPRPPHIAPEDVATGQRGPASDQYALAALVHECLAGTPPAAVSVSGVAPLPRLAAARPELPAHVLYAISRALSVKPAERFPGVLDFVAALESGRVSLADARPSGTSAASTTVLMDHGWKPPTRALLNPKVVRIAALAGIALAAVLAAPRLTELMKRSQYRAPLPPQPAAPTAPPVADSTAAAAAPPAEVRSPRFPSRRTRAQQARAAEGEPREGNQPARPQAQPRPADAAAPLPATAEPGRLFVNATPWGQVFVDGRPVGNTPRANLPIPPGTHTVRIVRDGFEPHEQTVQVAPGAVVRLTGIVLVERRP